MKTVLFLSDYEDEEEYNAVLGKLQPHGIQGFTAKPCEISLRNSAAGSRFYFREKEITPDLVVGYAYEQDLIPAIKLMKLWQFAGITVLNNGDTLFCGQNKDISSAMLNAAEGVRHLPYYKFNRLPNEDELYPLAFPLVAKPVNGACGRGLFKLDDYQQLCQWFGTVRDDLHNYYVQPYIPKLNNEDYRVVVVNHRACYAYSRRGAKGSWITNLMQDGTGQVFEVNQLPSAVIEMAEKSSRAARASFCGVDIALDYEQQPFIIEINTCPAIKIVRYIPGAAEHVENAYAAYILQALNSGKGDAI